jgi:hypothetical protein
MRSHYLLCDLGMNAHSPLRPRHYLAQGRAGTHPGRVAGVAKPRQGPGGHAQRFTPLLHPLKPPHPRAHGAVCRMQSDNVAVACFLAETLFGFPVACGSMRLEAPGRGVLLGGDHFGSHLGNCFQVFSRPRFKI